MSTIKPQRQHKEGYAYYSTTPDKVAREVWDKSGVVLGFDDYFAEAVKVDSKGDHNKYLKHSEQSKAGSRVARRRARGRNTPSLDAFIANKKQRGAFIMSGKPPRGVNADDVVRSAVRAPELQRVLSQDGLAELNDLLATSFVPHPPSASLDSFQPEEVFRYEVGKVEAVKIDHRLVGFKVELQGQNGLDVDPSFLAFDRFGELIGSEIKCLDVEAEPITPTPPEKDGKLAELATKWVADNSGEDQLFHGMHRGEEGLEAFLIEGDQAERLVKVASGLAYRPLDHFSIDTDKEAAILVVPSMNDEQHLHFCVINKETGAARRLDEANLADFDTDNAELVALFPEISDPYFEGYEDVVNSLVEGSDELELPVDVGGVIDTPELEPLVREIAEDWDVRTEIMGGIVDVTHDSILLGDGHYVTDAQFREEVEDQILAQLEAHGATIAEGSKLELNVTNMDSFEPDNDAAMIAVADALSDNVFGYAPANTEDRETILADLRKLGNTVGSYYGKVVTAKVMVDAEDYPGGPVPATLTMLAHNRNGDFARIFSLASGQA